MTLYSLTSRLPQHQLERDRHEVERADEEVEKAEDGQNLGSRLQVELGVGGLGLKSGTVVTFKI
jgi:hypothetical protein